MFSPNYLLPLLFKVAFFLHLVFWINLFIPLLQLIASISLTFLLLCFLRFWLDFKDFKTNKNYRLCYSILSFSKIMFAKCKEMWIGTFKTLFMPILLHQHPSSSPFNLPAAFCQKCSFEHFFLSCHFLWGKSILADSSLE